MTAVVRVHIVVSGRVQGVGFRYSTVAEGRRLGLRGWARNAADGAVEIVAEGDARSVRALIDWCHDGPPSARVTGVQQSEWPGDEPLGEFGVKW
jgi:acylphosphatase